MGVCHQPLQVRLQHRQKGISKITEQALKKHAGRINLFTHRSLTDLKLWKSHLEQTESARAELVLALPVFKRQKLDELIYEHWVGKMIKGDLLPLGNKKSKDNYF